MGKAQGDMSLRELLGFRVKDGEMILKRLEEDSSQWAYIDRFLVDDMFTLRQIRRYVRKYFPIGYGALDVLCSEKREQADDPKAREIMELFNELSEASQESAKSYLTYLKLLGKQ